MKHNILNVEEAMESRLHAVIDSLHAVSGESMKAVTDELFPDPDHPGLGIFLNAISDPANGPFYHAMSDDHTHVLYAHGLKEGMWFIRGIGTGPVRPGLLEIISEIVEEMADLPPLKPLP